MALAVWGSVAPAPHLDAEPSGPVYYTATTWAKAHAPLTRCTAQRHLEALEGEGPDKVLVSALYRVAGHRQKLRVYWPKGIAPPG